MVVTWVYIFVKTHLAVLLNTVQFIVCKLYLNKVFIFKTPTIIDILVYLLLDFYLYIVYILLYIHM